MPSRSLRLSGLVIGVLFGACTPTGASLELELPEEEWTQTDVEPSDDSFDDERHRPEPPEIDAGDALPGELCQKASTVAVAFEVESPEDPGGGRLLTKLDDGRVLGLPLEHTRFESIVVGTVAETTVTQRFGNPLSDPIEVVYTFPLPHDGAVDDYWLQIGQRRIEGEIHRRKDAQEIYQEAKDAGQSAGLLEQERPNIFTQHVANVPPGESIEVSMHIVQPLRPVGTCIAQAVKRWHFPKSDGSGQVVVNYPFVLSLP